MLETVQIRIIFKKDFKLVLFFERLFVNKTWNNLKFIFNLCRESLFTNISSK